MPAARSGRAERSTSTRRTSSSPTGPTGAIGASSPSAAITGSGSRSARRPTRSSHSSHAPHVVRARRVRQPLDQRQREAAEMVEVGACAPGARASAGPRRFGSTLSIANLERTFARGRRAGAPALRAADYGRLDDQRFPPPRARSVPSTTATSPCSSLAGPPSPDSAPPARSGCRRSAPPMEDAQHFIVRKNRVKLSVLSPGGPVAVLGPATSYSASARRRAARPRTPGSRETRGRKDAGGACPNRRKQGCLPPLTSHRYSMRCARLSACSRSPR